MIFSSMLLLRDKKLEGVFFILFLRILTLNKLIKIAFISFVYFGYKNACVIGNTVFLGSATPLTGLPGCYFYLLILDLSSKSACHYVYLACMYRALYNSTGKKRR